MIGQLPCGLDERLDADYDDHDGDGKGEDRVEDVVFGKPVIAAQGDDRGDGREGIHSLMPGICLHGCRMGFLCTVIGDVEHDLLDDDRCDGQPHRHPEERRVDDDALVIDAVPGILLTGKKADDRFRHDGEGRREEKDGQDDAGDGGPAFVAIVVFVVFLVGGDPYRDDGDDGRQDIPCPWTPSEKNRLKAHDPPRWRFSRFPKPD